MILLCSAYPYQDNKIISFFSTVHRGVPLKPIKRLVVEGKWKKRKKEKERSRWERKWVGEREKSWVGERRWEREKTAWGRKKKGRKKE